MKPDVLIFGGGVAGLWILGVLRRAGYETILLENKALGRGQSIGSQGIIHGGGKYAIRGLRDVASVREHGRMPSRWRDYLKGRQAPDLSDVSILSERCLMWSPGRSLRDRTEAYLFPLLRMTGLLNVPPEPLDPSQRPKILSEGVGRVEAMAEPVLASHTLLEALAKPYRDYIRLYYPGSADAGLKFTNLEGKTKDGRVSVTVPVAGGTETVEIHPRLVILAAGRGNQKLLDLAGLGLGFMQERPLSMILLRGPLEPLFGHCVARNRTQLTVTTPIQSTIIDKMANSDKSKIPEADPKLGPSIVWQIGGEIAERYAHEHDDEDIIRGAKSDLRRWMPQLDLSSCQISFYRAIRAESHRPGGHKPISFYVGHEKPGLMAVWPTKLALVPLLADSVLEGVRQRLAEPSQGNLPDSFFRWPMPEVAPYPWQEAQWHPAS